MTIEITGTFVLAWTLILILGWSMIVRPRERDE